MNKVEEAAGLPQTANYRYAKRVGNQLFVAGQVPHDPDARLVGPSDPPAQARQCLANLQKLLEVHGFNLGDIQQLTVCVAGEQADLVEAWSAVEEWFDRSVPPATLLGVSRLGYTGQIVEIDAVVVRDDG